MKGTIRAMRPSSVVTLCEAICLSETEAGSLLGQPVYRETLPVSVLAVAFLVGWAPLVVDMLIVAL